MGQSMGFTIKLYWIFLNIAGCLASCWLERNFYGHIVAFLTLMKSEDGLLHKRSSFIFNFLKTQKFWRKNDTWNSFVFETIYQDSIFNFRFIKNTVCDSVLSLCIYPKKCLGAILGPVPSRQRSPFPPFTGSSEKHRLQSVFKSRYVRFEEGIMRVLKQKIAFLPLRYCKVCPEGTARNSSSNPFEVSSCALCPPGRGADEKIPNKKFCWLLWKQKWQFSDSTKRIEPQKNPALLSIEILVV